MWSSTALNFMGILEKQLEMRMLEKAIWRCIKSEDDVSSMCLVSTQRS